MNTATFTFYFNNSKEADLILNVLNPEIKNKIPKSKVKLEKIENKLCLEIRSSDISSLRAASNSYLRWIKTAIFVNKII